MLKLWTQHWWWVILPLMVITLAYAYVSPSLDKDFFCEGSDSCFRAWVSALSGYFALIAAGATVLAMSAQRADAIRHQKENIELAIMGRLSTARTYSLVLSVARVLLPQPEDIKPAEDADIAWFEDTRYTTWRNHLAQLMAQLQNPIVARYENEIGVPIQANLPLKWVQSALEILDHRYEQFTRGRFDLGEAYSEENVLKAIGMAFGQSRAYIDLAFQSSAQFQNKWSVKIS